MAQLTAIKASDLPIDNDTTGGVVIQAKGDRMSRADLNPKFDELEGKIDGAVSGFKGTIAIADTKTEDGIYTPEEEGTYPLSGGLTYLPETTDKGYKVTFIKSGAEWFKDRQDLGLTDYPDADDIMKESEFVNKEEGKNKFNPSKIQLDKYLASSNNGNLQPITNWAVSDYIKVNAGETWIISGRHSSDLGVSFFANNTDTEAIHGTYIVTSSAFVIPAGANYLIFSIYRASNPTIPPFLQIEKNSVATEYEAYSNSIKIKPEYLPAPESPTDIFDSYINISDEIGSSYITNIIDGKVLKQIIYPRGRETRPFDTGNILYDDVIIRATGDDTPPYWLENTVYGANHVETYPNVDRVNSITVDGKEIFENGKYGFKDKVTISEYYKLVSASGHVANVAYSYVIDTKGVTVVYTSFLATKTGTRINRLCALQCMPFVAPYSCYVPNTLPFTQDGVDWDFSQKQVMPSGNLASALDFTDGRTTSEGILADRVVQIKPNLIFQFGYIPVEMASLENRRDNIKLFPLNISNIKKTYLKYLDFSTPTDLTKGDYYTAVAFRAYNTPKGSTTAFQIVKTTYGTFLFIDWHVTVNEKLDIGKEFIGFKVEVISNSNSVTLLTKNITDGNLEFDVISKGNIVIKLTRN